MVGDFHTCWHGDALIDNVLLVHLHHNRVSREDLLRADIVVHDVSEFVRIRTVGMSLLESIEFGLAIHDGEVAMFAVVHIFGTLPRNGERRRIVGRAHHLIGVPFRL